MFLSAGEEVYGDGAREARASRALSLYFAGPYGPAKYRDKAREALASRAPSPYTSSPAERNIRCSRLHQRPPGRMAGLLARNHPPFPILPGQARPVESSKAAGFREICPSHSSGGCHGFTPCSLFIRLRRRLCPFGRDGTNTPIFILLTDYRVELRLIVNFCPSTFAQ